MKITDKHVSDASLNALIVTAEVLSKLKNQKWYETILKTALELKQRRAEDRQLAASRG